MDLSQTIKMIIDDKKNGFIKTLKHLWHVQSNIVIFILLSLLNNWTGTKAGAR